MAGRWRDASALLSMDFIIKLRALPGTTLAV
jgi:hypothetical protein